MKKNWLQLSGYIISGIIVLLWIILLFVFVLFQLNTNSTDSEDVLSYYEYQTLRIKSETNETSFGFTTLSRHLKPNEYISYDDVFGYSNLISNFGEDEYVCHGVCYCNSNNEETTRRFSSAASSLTRRLLTYLVVSVSSFSAYQIAKEYFETECVDKLSDSCPSMISSEITDCVKIMSTDNIDDDYDYDSEFDEREVTKDLLDGKYLCKGTCIGFLDDEDACTDLKVTDVWMIDTEKMGITDSMVSNERGKYEQRMEDPDMVSPNKMITLMYAKIKLNPFCKKCSKNMKPASRRKEGSLFEKLEFATDERVGLKEMIDERRVFRAVFSRYGAKVKARRSFVVVDVTDLITGNVVANHLWFFVGKRISRLGRRLEEGDNLQFKARVRTYYKRGNTIDVKLKFASDWQLIEKDGTIIRAENKVSADNKRGRMYGKKEHELCSGFRETLDSKYYIHPETVCKKISAS